MDFNKTEQYKTKQKKNYVHILKYKFLSGAPTSLQFAL